jgi:hypothetical protein
MAEISGDYTPGRSLLAEMTDLREQMTTLKAAMLQLVDLQREMHTKLDAALNFRNIGGGENTSSDQVV